MQLIIYTFYLTAHAMHDKRSAESPHHNTASCYDGIQLQRHYYSYTLACQVASMKASNVSSIATYLQQQR
jgi:hypothetical protein